jgi:hypothetical protein
MKVLLVHPEDYPGTGAWARQRWDLIVDLAFAGPSIYEEWSRQCSSRVISLHHFAGQTESYRWIGETLERGRGKLPDRFGLDWWELLSVLSFHEMHGFYLVRKLRKEIGFRDVELAGTRPHLYSELLSETLGLRVKYFERPRTGLGVQVSRKLRAFRTFHFPQLMEIAFDKWDGDYRLRRHFSQARRAKLKDSAVLLPSAYSNVTRTVLEYAKLFPDRRFLLAITRRSASAAALPENVSCVPLGAYAVSSKATDDETAQLRSAWESFCESTLQTSQELQTMARAGFWRSVPSWLRIGLRARDAWQQILDCEPIEAVLCADDLNVMTRLPLVLANRAGLGAIQTHHGALDGGFLFKKPYAKVHLVKGEMERDYLQGTGSVNPRSIRVGSPSTPMQPTERGSNGDLVFFSQPSEVDGGRMLDIYRELLPRLCSVADTLGRRVIVKLHPFESRKDRQRLVDCVLTERERTLVRISTAPASEVIDRTWGGIGLDSTVAIECALKRVPYFLCGWLDFTGIGYLRQFVKYGVGILLEQPADIMSIPEVVASYQPDPRVLESLAYFPGAAALEAALFGTDRDVDLHKQEQEIVVKAGCE